MRKTQGIILGIFTLLLLPPTLAFGAEIHNLNEAVNVAGRQRMYTMRMLKDYIMIGEKLSYKDPAGDLKKIKEEFGKAHDSLVAYVKDPALSEELKHIGTLWDAVDKMTNEPPRKDQMGTYAKKAITFRQQLNAFVDHLAKSEGEKKATAEEINMSGRLRAVSQALAAVYLLRAWGMPHADEKIKEPMKFFRLSLDYLNKAKETQPPMQALLKDLEKIYLFFEVMNQSKVFTPTLVIKKTDAMLQKASELTELYVQSTK